MDCYKLDKRLHDTLLPKAFFPAFVIRLGSRLHRPGIEIGASNVRYRVGSAEFTDRFLEPAISFESRVEGDLLNEGRFERVVLDPVIAVIGK
jgi:hypothetical protein